MSRIELSSNTAGAADESASSDTPAAEPSADPFGDLRPQLPAALDDLLDRAGAAPPLALIAQD